MVLGSLFSGIGGFDLAARWMGWRTAWFSEIDEYACRVLKKHWPDVPNYGDITKIDGRSIEPVDVIAGGFPCQDISAAGKGTGIEGTRSKLWTEYARLIAEIRPKYAVIENSPMLRSRGLDQVLQTLYEIGYDAEWNCIPASAVGARHRRDRIWIVAYPSREQLEECIDVRGKDIGWSHVEPARSSEGMADSQLARVAHDRYQATDSASSEMQRERLQRERLWIDVRERFDDAGRVWEVEPNVGRVVNGLSPAMDRIRCNRVRCIGNSVVPQIPFLIFKAIEQREMLLR